MSHAKFFLNRAKAVKTKVVQYYQIQFTPASINFNPIEIYAHFADRTIEIGASEYTDIVLFLFIGLLHTKVVLVATLLLMFKSLVCVMCTDKNYVLDLFCNYIFNNHFSLFSGMWQSTFDITYNQY